MGSYLHGLGTIGMLRSVTHLEVRPDPTSPEWFRLGSSHLSNKQLFMMLEAIWPAIVGAEARKYALIHCMHGMHAGVWFHLLPDSDYEPGCHEILDF